MVMDYGTLMEHRRQNARFTVAELRHLATDMPYKGEAKKADILAWLRKYHPERLEEH